MISRPTMICVLKENTKGLTHMNKKQLWKIIEEKGLTDKAFELEKNHKRKRIRRSIEVVDLETNEKMFFQKVADAAEYYNKSYVFSIYNNRKEWEKKKINVIDH